MTSNWVDILATIGVQHVWQSAILLALAGLVFNLRPLGADVRSWLWLCVFVLAVVSPLAVFLPGSEAAAVAMPTHASTIPLGDIAHDTASAARDEMISKEMLRVLKHAAMLVWLLGFAWSLVRLVGGWNQARRLRGAAHPAPSIERLLADELPRETRIKVSDQIASPMVVGLSRQCILVPRTLVAELPEAVLLDILRHEIAHVRRHDMWVLLAQRFLLAIHWWSPFLRLIGTRLDLAREMACDERASRQPGERRTYARSLLTSVDKVLSLAHQRHLLASAIFDTRKGLTQRIEGLLNMESKQRQSVCKPALMLCGAAMMASIALTVVATPRVASDAFATATDGGVSQSRNAALLVDAAEAGHVEEVRRLIRSGVGIDDRVAGDGTALIVAAKSGNLAMVDALLGMGAAVDQSAEDNGNPLVVAAMAGHHDVVDRLIAAGANVNAIVAHDETPLINAAREGHLSIVQCLVEKGADVNLGVMADLGRWRSPLNQAQGNDVRKFLINHGARAGKT